MRDQNNFGQRQMYQGDWTCSGCGAKITELPFEPDGDRPIFCRECHRERAKNRPNKRRF
jgi:CxxC-x17-CxxC domain-containing protein